jgi:mutator protein MutT
MLVLDAGQCRFQVRAGALIRQNGHILVHRSVTDQFWTLPGGRVEMGEAGAETVVREIEEELGVSSVAGSLRVIIENFFEYQGRAGHEIGLYFDVTLTSDFPFHAEDVVHRHHDGGSDLEFRWVIPKPDLLDEYGLKPAPLKPLLNALPSELVQIVCRDGVS